MSETWKAGDGVLIEHDNKVVTGIVMLASPNSASLMLGFEAIIDRHVGMMPVLRHEDGVYRSIISQTAVQLSRAH
jgi:hypothetical protein